MFLFNNKPGVGFLTIHFYWCGIIMILTSTFAPSNKEFTIYFEKIGSKWGWQVLALSSHTFLAASKQCNTAGWYLLHSTYRHRGQILIPLNELSICAQFWNALLLPFGNVVPLRNLKVDELTLTPKLSAFWKENLKGCSHFNKRDNQLNSHDSVTRLIAWPEIN